VDTVAGIRWYELRRDAGQDDWYIYQQGTYCPADGLSRWMASIAMNGNGDIALGYSMTGHAMFPSVAYTGQTAGAPLGEMNIEEVVAIVGTHSQNTSARWGDYSAMAIDPVDDTTFWYTGEYMPSSGWGTRVVSFDFGPIQAPTAYAGPDSEVCFFEVYNAQGSVTGQQSVLWTSSGNGNLLNPNTLTPIYFRGSQDVQNGYFELSLIAYGFEPGMEAIDVVHVDIINETDVDLGSDTLICANHTLQLFPELANVDSLHWTTSGDGLFSNDAIAEPFYTPGVQDVLNGEVTLNLYAEAFAPCEGDDEDEIVVTLDPCTAIDEIADKVRLNIFPNPSAGIFNIDISGLQEPGFKMKVMNSQGQLVFSGDFNSDDKSYVNSINLTYKPTGVYYVVLESETEQIIKKIVFE
jgi:hypothetical protein